MLPVVAGEVDPFWGGDIYCTVIHLTGQIGDFGRMRAWTDALKVWSSELLADVLVRRDRAGAPVELRSRRGDGTRPPPSWDP